jgi:hypothetical protein
MKKILLVFSVFLAMLANAQVQRPLEVVQDVINFGDSISVYIENNTLLPNPVLRPAYVPRMTDTVYAPYSAPFTMVDAMIGPVEDMIGQTLQMYDAGFTPFFFYSDGVTWITSQLAYLTNTPYSIEFQDSIFHDFHGNDTYDLMWPGDSLADGVDTGYITVYVNNYVEGVGIPITIYDLDGTDWEYESFFDRNWLEVDGESVFWYDWERTLVDDTTTWMYVVDRSKINWGAETFVVGKLEFSYPRGYSEGGPPSEPYPAKSYAIKIMITTPE